MSNIHTLSNLINFPKDYLRSLLLTEAFTYIVYFFFLLELFRVLNIEVTPVVVVTYTIVFHYCFIRLSGSMED